MLFISCSLVAWSTPATDNKRRNSFVALLLSLSLDKTRATTHALQSAVDIFVALPVSLLVDLTVASLATFGAAGDCWTASLFAAENDTNKKTAKSQLPIFRSTFCRAISYQTLQDESFVRRKVLPQRQSVVVEHVRQIVMTSELFFLWAQKNTTRKEKC